VKKKLESKLEPIEVTIARRLGEFRLHLASRFGGIWAQWANGESGPARHSIFFLLCLGVALNLVSIAAPGYFGMDEIWAHSHWIEGRSLGEALSLSHESSHGGSAFRPLTYKVWHALSFFFYEMPVLFILSNALLSILNGVLIYHLVLRVSMQMQTALWAFLVFNLLPSSTFNVGWVGTIADKLYLIFALAALHILISDRKATLEGFGVSWSLASLSTWDGWRLTGPEMWRQIGVALCFLLGLMSKEPMMVFTAFVGGLCLFVKPWRGWIWSLLISIPIVAIYLALRAPALLDKVIIPPSLSNIFPHMLMYWVWPFTWDNWMLYNVRTAPGSQLWLAGILASLPVLLLLMRGKWRWALAYLGYYFVFVSPALPHCCTFAHYLYAAGLPMALAFAYAFRRGERFWLRAVACGLFAMLVLHSAYIQMRFYEHGKMQQRTIAGLAAIVRVHDRLAGNEETKFAITADSYYTWNVLYRSFWPPGNGNAKNIAGIDLRHRLTFHQGDLPPAPAAGAVRLRITPEGYLVEE